MTDVAIKVIGCLVVECGFFRFARANHDWLRFAAVFLEVAGAAGFDDFASGFERCGRQDDFTFRGLKRRLGAWLIGVVTFDTRDDARAFDVVVFK